MQTFYEKYLIFLCLLSMKNLLTITIAIDNGLNNFNRPNNSILVLNYSHRSVLKIDSPTRADLESSAM